MTADRVERNGKKYEYILDKDIWSVMVETFEIQVKSLLQFDVAYFRPCLYLRCPLETKFIRY